MLTALLGVLTLGFMLGMRHATDPDHVVAVTTIVSQQRSLARAARTGILWGVGHTISLFAVDIYHGILQHKTYETPYLIKQIKDRALDKNNQKGRIWRVVYRGP